MGKQIILPNIDLAKIGNTLVETEKTVVTFISNHLPEFLTTILVGITIDNIRVRIGRKKDKRAIEENMVKQQQVIRIHEAEINSLKDEAEQSQQAFQKVDQLAQIVNNMTEEGVYR